MAKNSCVNVSEYDNRTAKTTNFTRSNIDIVSYLVGMPSGPLFGLMTPTEADFFSVKNSSPHALLCAICMQDKDDSSDAPLLLLRDLLEIQNNSLPSSTTIKL